MGRLVRFGVSLEADLLGKFDRLIKERRYTCRSEALRDLIRQELVQKQWQESGAIAGAITLIYDHHKRELVNTLMDIQHDFGGIIISSSHIHLDHNNCLEIIAVKGAPKEAQGLADNLKSVKGVKHATLSMSSTGRNI
ncbi:MAG: nickel-responsive transcriptional regulator NikR [Candidatus Omnitrophica bacterium]|jgi:CopG family nickel-responsive transcriptional regulator|nr:nickel-responsive transcriptional regulator NikR [Candidatus Omnitrophota bacterium]MDD5518827.1 nickel-responsive transcriptional regulator NikR [Candidatus Omnitrophota bacterium]